METLAEESRPTVTEGAMPHRILVVDDHPLQCRVLARQLESLGHRAICASDTDEALLLLSAGHIDLALVACNARMDAFAFARKLRESARDACPIIACFGDAGRDARADILAGVHACIRVPITMHALAEVVASLLPREPVIPYAHAAFDSWSLFERTSRDDLAAARVALAAGQRGAVQSSLHRIKGAALMLQHEGLAAACAVAESAAEYASVAAVREGIDAVEARLSGEAHAMSASARDHADASR
jgi:two-component system sensor histidine kinase EvgS